MSKTPTDYPTLSSAHVRSTDLRQVHASTEPLTVELIRDVPGYANARRAVRAFADYQAGLEVTAFRRAADVLRDALVDAASSDDPIPPLAELLPGVAAIPVYEGMHKQLGVDIVVDGPAVLARRAADTALPAAQSVLAARLDHILVSNTGHILGRITAKLEELVDQAREVLGTGGLVSDASDAIEQGRVEEWKASKDLGAQYAELRTLQRFWTEQSPIGSSMTSITGSPGLFTLYVANPLEVDPHLSRRTSGSNYVNAATEAAFQATGGARSPWPADWLTGDAIWWFAQHRDAKPWAPTATQYERAQQDVQQAVADHSRTGRSRKTEARAQAKIDAQLRREKGFIR